MRILCVDIGTGTQDIFLYDSRIDVENGFKMVIPAPTMIVRRQIQQAANEGRSVLLTGVTMGGGPSHWAVEDHIKMGLQVFATPAAARSFNDDLQIIREMGIRLVDPDEVGNLSGDLVRVQLKDFDFTAIASAFRSFGVSLSNLDALAVAVFDHGAAPPGYSDRRFRFDYIHERVMENDRLSTFAFLAHDSPAIMTRMHSVISSAAGVDAPLILMDTAPAAVLGACFDPEISHQRHKIVANIGNFHTLAFRLLEDRIVGVFEHHTGLLDQKALDGWLRELAKGTISDEAVFNDSGHGAYTMSSQESIGDAIPPVFATGPRRSLMAGSSLKPTFATPFGDMMLSGCFGLLAATAELLPDLAGPILSSLTGSGGSGTPPWEIA